MTMVRCGVVLMWIGYIAQAAPPETRKSPVVDTYHATTVRDDYRWLEDASSAAVQKWSDAQNAYARAFLDRLPQADAIRREVTSILSNQSIRYFNVSVAAGRVFCERLEPPQQQPVIVVLDDLAAADSARVLVDPNQLDPSGLTSIDWYRVSPDGKRLAVSLSVGGSELGDLKIVDVEQGAWLDESIEKVNSGTAGGSLAWTPDSQAFFYTRHLPLHPQRPDDHRVFQHVYFHQLGTDVSEDRYELGEGFPEIAEIQLASDVRTGRLLATVQKGDGGQFAHYLRSPDGTWRQFSRFGDGLVQAVFGPKDQLYLVSLAGSPRGRLLEVSASSLDLDEARVVIPEGSDTIVSGGTAFWGEQTVLCTSDRLYVVYQTGGPSELRAFDTQGQPLAPIGQLDVGAVFGVQLLSNGQLLFGNTSYVQPECFYRYDPASGTTVATSLRSNSSVSFDDITARRLFARSPDGTRVPMTVMLRKDLELNGDNPCILYGYGGYGISMEPSFRPLNHVLLRRGVIYVVANLRGGGEFGEQWHRDGALTKKQNVFDDFAACLRELIDQRFTSPSRLAIMGGSNGGLLMGATLTQHPELVRAVVSLVGIYDMLRVELSPNGAFNVTEFGTVKDADQFRALLAYSPLHQVVDGVDYPATLFLTGRNDPRVDPMQSRKMTARLQAATGDKGLILLRTSANAGHGSGNSVSEQIEQTVDIFAFLCELLRVPIEER